MASYAKTSRSRKKQRQLFDAVLFISAALTVVVGGNWIVWELLSRLHLASRLAVTGVSLALTSYLAWVFISRITGPSRSELAEARLEESTRAGPIYPRK